MEHLVHTPEQLGLVLNNQRRARQLTQAQAARAVGLRAKTVSGLENRPAGATLASFFKLLAALDLELVIRRRGPSSTSHTEW
ncbi:HTH-type transcriptional regulator/antitoxin HipB [Methylohalomonas lacus]|uniref:HTH-type transcriptional regulator/antitoxin HipB n=1 Tax=Methylohalomonas lacus TaxID=398773 RepID=A0AAE3HPH6_9GAMM|nr:helix-turn-helix domain-containing protein [Methylohalomonas lacus]MCS3904513.1 HTH-type transcriptional regulator/antitoxin HipB [Methylohalomonas lacus]